MANDVLYKYGTVAALPITISVLPTSTSGYKGRKSSFVSNITRGYPEIMLYVSIREGANAVSNKSVLIKFLRGADSVGVSIGHANSFRGDNVAVSDVNCTAYNAPMVGIMNNVGTTGQILKKSFVVQNPGRYWAVMITHNMGVNLGLTVSAGVTGNYVRWSGIKPQVQ